MKKFTDILTNGAAESLRKQWSETEAAGEFSPMPKGEYVARIIGGELMTGKTKGTLGYKLTFRVLEGEHQGRQFWLDNWLTPDAIPWAKRNLSKLGVTSLDQLEHQIPPGFRCRVKLDLRKDDNGTEYNKVRRFDVIGIDPIEPDAFAPADADGEGGGND